MTKPWTEIFDAVQLDDAAVGDEVVVNIVNYQAQHVAFIPRTIERATPKYVWAYGIKFKRNGTPSKKRRCSRVCVTLYNMTPERYEYLKATGRIRE